MEAEYGSALRERRWREGDKEGGKTESLTFQDTLRCVWTRERERAREIAGACVIGFERRERARALQRAIPLRPPLVPAALSAAAPLPPTAVRRRGKGGGRGTWEKDC